MTMRLFFICKSHQFAVDASLHSRDHKWWLASGIQVHLLSDFLDVQGGNLLQVHKQWKYTALFCMCIIFL